ncbi:MAG: sensor histidine kinase [Gemmatimonadota bacterium]
MAKAPDEVIALKSQVRDLAALLALQSIWKNRDASYIAESLLDVLVSLLRLDVAYIKLGGHAPALPLEIIRPMTDRSSTDIMRALEVAGKPGEEPSAVSNPFGEGELKLARLRPQVGGDSGVVVIGSVRSNFPNELENFLFRVGVDQAVVAINAALLVQELRQANEAKSRFLATMSHELRTPLNAIIGYLDLLQAEVAGSLTSGQRQHLDRIGIGARHLIDLIEQILTFARIEAGKEELHWATVDVVSLVKKTSQLIEPLAASKGLRFELHVPAQPIFIDTDEGKLRQILLNLLSNAIKFTARGEVGVALTNNQKEIILTVADTGPGITAHLRELIFEPFRQVEEPLVRSTGGTGLGLAVCRQLARLLSGDVTVASTPGQGSAFTLRIPKLSRH